MTAYYNEFDKKAAAWLRELIVENLIPPGDVDERSITDVDPTELAGYRQLHFFAGVGGWPIAARLAGWPDDREIVTGSCPCQPFSVAGKGAGTADARHLWPDFFRIIRARRPACVMGEQVAAAVGKDWLLGVRTDMEGIGYAGRGVVVPACAVNAPGRRDRLWFAYGCGDVPNAERERLRGQRPYPAASPAEGVQRADEQREWIRADVGAICLPGDSDLADSPGKRLDGRAAAAREREGAGAGLAVSSADAWAQAKWLICHDGKARRIEPSIPLLVDGLPNRAPLLRGYGNAIVPQIAAEMMAAWLEEFP